MLTVKVFRNKNEDGLSLGRERIIAAVEVSTGYHTTDGDFSGHYVMITDYKGHVHTFDLVHGTDIFVENLSGKTVQVYRHSPKLK